MGGGVVLRILRLDRPPGWLHSVGEPDAAAPGGRWKRGVVQGYRGAVWFSVLVGVGLVLRRVFLECLRWRVFYVIIVEDPEGN